MDSKSHSPLKSWSEETVAVVTGANKGIGFALVRRLAQLGLTVVLTSRDAAKGWLAVESLKAENLRVEYRRLDVADAGSIKEFASWAKERFGGLDVLVNNAGVSFNEIGENSVEHAETVIQTNFYGAKQLTETLLPLFRRSAAGSRILNISSQLGLLDKLKNPTLKASLADDSSLSEELIDAVITQFLAGVKTGTWKSEGWPDVWTDYSVSKLALNAYSRLLARRLADDGLRVNCFCPGFTRTAMTHGQGNHSAEEAAELAARIVLMPAGELPTGRFFKWRTALASSKL